ncbi:ABC transporter permease [Aerococcus agrisoli]|uniref:ABC transporter permease n=1 Tax=Aerococcus agrisoli TaxID=2487350 RepID=A0A3N4FXP5_9LACT|nr:ABC transporter permease [Aerococcus agrisoli]RPA55539.1 ABC transporter permease [Aerococcus agrisoli]
MGFGMLAKLSFNGIKNRLTIYFPYFLSIVLLMSLEYIMVSLIGNEYVQTRSYFLPMIMIFAVNISTMLIAIFMFYANNFIQKQRRLEFGLYTVLGLERKHLSIILFIEQVLVWLTSSLFAIGIGFVIGKLLFIWLNRLMKNTGATLMDYPFSPLGAITTVVISGLILFAILLLNSFRLTSIKPTELLNQKNAGEKEPKANYLFLLIGLITTGLGYYIALTLDNPLNDLLFLFGAIILIIIGTYCLFISLSIFILKALKANKKIYYQPKNFLSISGMLYRMKANAVSLASIAVLCTGIILTLGTTLSLYLGMDAVIEQSMPRDYQVDQIPVTGNNFADESEKMETTITTILGDDAQLTNTSYTRQFTTGTIFDDGTFFPDDGKPQALVYVLAQTLDEFNQQNNTNYVLQDNEILYASPADEFNGYEEIRFQANDKTTTYQTVQVSPKLIPSNFVGSIALVVFNTTEELENFATAYNSPMLDAVSFIHSYSFDAADKKTAAKLDEIVTTDDGVVQTDDGTLYRFNSQKYMATELYALNGGFLFLGIVVSTVLVIGTVLMLYFKQISEGYDDKDKFATMQQVGLPDDLIRSTIRSQVFWIFALPSLVAVIHALVAQNIMVNLLAILGVTDKSVMWLAYIIILAAFLAIYGICYWLTSKMYYRIIHA